MATQIQLRGDCCGELRQENYWKGGSSPAEQSKDHNSNSLWKSEGDKHRSTRKRHSSDRVCSPRHDRKQVRCCPGTGRFHNRHRGRTSVHRGRKLEIRWADKVRCTSRNGPITSRDIHLLRPLKGRQIDVDSTEHTLVHRFDQCLVDQVWAKFPFRAPKAQSHRLWRVLRRSRDRPETLVRVWAPGHRRFRPAWGKGGLGKIGIFRHLCWSWSHLLNPVHGTTIHDRAGRINSFNVSSL